VLHITTEISGSKPPQRTTAKRKHSLKQHLLERIKTWINSLLEGSAMNFWDEVGMCRQPRTMTITATAIGRAASTFSVWEKWNWWVESDLTLNTEVHPICSKIKDKTSPFFV
jgi:hypothetical protein